MTPTNPVLLEWTRGGLVEFKNRGAFALVREGRVVSFAGDIDEPAFLRSAAKFFQALVTLRGGLRKRFDLDSAMLAVLCASHGGEADHLAAVSQLLLAGGLREADLLCGAHEPLDPSAAAVLRANGAAPTALHHCCSGKHAGMLLAAKCRGMDLLDYLDPESALQQSNREFLAGLASVPLEEVQVAIDGCSAPTFVMTLRAAATAFSALSRGLPEEDSKTRDDAEALFSALAVAPRMIGGTNRFCTALLEVTSGRIIGKVGADGFYAAMDRQSGSGLALHVDDGGWAASERIAGGLLRHFDMLTSSEAERLGRHLGSIRRNPRGVAAGEVRFLEAPIRTGP